MGRYDGYWELNQKAGPGEARAEQIYKCTDCGAESHPDAGFNGAPDPGHCRDGCRNIPGDWRPGGVSDAYRRNYDRIFRGRG